MTDNIVFRILHYSDSSFTKNQLSKMIDDWYEESKELERMIFLQMNNKTESGDTLIVPNIIGYVKDMFIDDEGVVCICQQIDNNSIPNVKELLETETYKIVPCIKVINHNPYEFKLMHVSINKV